MAQSADVIDRYNLARFVEAQAPLIDVVLAELRAGVKRSHWMWFVFPQIKGLGSSDMAKRYAVSSLAEAEAYLRHPLLGERLRVCTAIVNALDGRNALQIFGRPDDMKFRSSVTLFALAAPTEPAFRRALDLYFQGRPDPATAALVANDGIRQPN